MSVMVNALPIAIPVSKCSLLCCVSLGYFIGLNTFFITLLLVLLDKYVTCTIIIILLFNRLQLSLVCNGNFLEHFISVSRIGLMSSASLQGIGSPLYIQNTDYPTGPIRAAETSASCSVETTSCSSQVKMFFVHFELSDGGGSCTGTQNLQVDDKDDFHTYTCSDNTDYTIKWKLTSSSNYLNLTLNNTDGTNDGKFKIGFEGMFKLLI